MGKRGARPIPDMKQTDIQGGKLKGTGSGKEHRGDSLDRMGKENSNFKKHFSSQSGKSPAGGTDTDE